MARAPSQGSDSVVVIGLGRFGGAVAEVLVRLGHDVLGLDEDAAVVQSWADRLTHVVQADTTNGDTLRRLGVHEFEVVLRFGFMENPDVPEALRLVLAGPPLGPLDPDELTYYFRRETVIPTERVAGMAVWREALFSMLHLNANRAAAYYGVPTAKVVEIGIEVEI